MAIEVRNFELEASRFVRESCRAKAEQQTVFFALDLRKRLAARSPKLTGALSASWNASLDEPDTSFRVRRDSAHPEGYFNPTGAVEDGRVSLDGFTLGRPIIIANAVPYIGYVNDGTSRIAPSKFFELTLEEVQALGR